MTDAGNTDAYDAPDEGDLEATSFFPSFESMEGPEPLTIDGHRLIDESPEND